MQFPTFQNRLRKIIEGIRGFGDLDMTVQWKKDLDSAETEYWVEAISKGTSDKVKKILDQENPPSVADIRGLDVVDGDNFDPSAYLGFTEPSIISEYKKSVRYTGSGTGVGWGIGKRTGQHLNEEYRDKELEKHPYHPFYHTLQDRTRTLQSFVVMVMGWLSHIASDLTQTRAICCTTTTHRMKLALPSMEIAYKSQLIGPKRQMQGGGWLFRCEIGG
ncbi:hypothetical protein CC80DRAFT_533067 [Byssothecium circinans]|uniref:Uncharacterized protein n=1 Tax=Byssothecium circinans TaxID=147558 RepID=A0A6A5UA01_9PLEO|nr:hypothetical protein CC80DRAFT_533067 [Byssothecium circinans]